MTTTPTTDGDRHHRADGGRPVTTVLHVGNLHWATEKAVVESLIGRIAGVEGVEANPVAQTATVTYDPAATSVATLRKWVEDCGYHCAGQSVPGHLCRPMNEPSGGAEPAPDHDAHHRADPAHSPHEAIGHGGHTGMSMAAMVADMRRRFVVAAAFSVPVLLWSAVGRDVLELRRRCPLRHARRRLSAPPEPAGHLLVSLHIF